MILNKKAIRKMIRSELLKTLKENDNAYYPDNPDFEKYEIMKSQLYERIEEGDIPEFDELLTSIFLS